MGVLAVYVKSGRVLLLHMAEGLCIVPSVVKPFPFVMLQVPATDISAVGLA